jgi:hypothetical protein
MYVLVCYLAYCIFHYFLILVSFPEWIAAFAHGETTQRYYYKVSFNIEFAKKNLLMVPATTSVSIFAKGDIAFQRHYSL